MFSFGHFGTAQGQLVSQHFCFFSPQCGANSWNVLSCNLVILFSWLFNFLVHVVLFFEHSNFSLCFWHGAGIIESEGTGSTWIFLMTQAVFYHQKEKQWENWKRGKNCVSRVSRAVSPLSRVCLALSRPCLASVSRCLAPVSPVSRAVSPLSCERLALSRPCLH